MYHIHILCTSTTNWIEILVLFIHWNETVNQSVKTVSQLNISAKTPQQQWTTTSVAWWYMYKSTHELSINIRRRAFSALYFSFKTENNKTTQRAYESCYGSIGRVSSLNIRIRNVSAYTKNFNFIFHFDFFWFFALLWKNF